MLLSKNETNPESSQMIKKKDHSRRQVQVEVKIKDKKFEENLADLEAIVQKLEWDSLEEAIAEYPRRACSLKTCKGRWISRCWSLVKVMQAITDMNAQEHKNQANWLTIRILSEQREVSADFD